jgi:hypothetical protein
LLLFFFLVISPVPFRPVLTCPISHWTAAQLSSVLLKPAQLSRIQLNSAQFSSIQLNSAQISSAKFSSAPVPFRPVLTCPIPHWAAGIFVCFRFLPNNYVQC